MKKRKEIKISKKNKKASKNTNNKFLISFQNIINRIRLYAADTANFKVIAGIATVAVIVCIYGIIAVSGAFIKISPATPSSADMAGSDARTAQVMALSPTGAQFPSLNMEVPTTAPVPEFIRIGIKQWTVSFGGGIGFLIRFGVLEPGVKRSRSEERRVGKECRSRWSPYH